MRMIAAIDQAKALERKAAPPKIKRYVGEAVYIYAFDVAYEMSRQPITHLLGQPVEPFQVDTDKRIPRHQLFYRPQMVRLPAVERIGPHGPVQLERVIKVLPVGAANFLQELRACDPVDVGFELLIVDEAKALIETCQKRFWENYAKLKA